MVRARLERARVLPEGLHLHRDRQPVPHVRRGRVHDHPRPVSPGRLAGSADYLRGDLPVGRQGAGGEARACRRPRFDPVGPEGAPVVPVRVPGHQVPAAPVVYQAVGLHRAPAGRPGMGTVVEPESLVISAGARDEGQHVRVHLWPAGRHGQRRRGERADPVAQPRGKHLLQLGQRPHRGLFDPGDGAVRGGPQSDRGRHRLLVVEQQRRQGTPRAEPVAAGHTRAGLDRIAERAQPSHVVADGPGGDVEPDGELGAGPVAPRLEQGEQAQQARRRFQHSSILPPI
jgi:hypothetical protein